MANILYYKCWGMWDFIASIPKRYQIKDNWDNLYFLSFDKKYKKKLYIFSEFDKIALNKWLVEKIIEIPYNKLKLLWFCAKNFHKYDKFYMPIKTKWWCLFGKILSKKIEYTFESKRDTSKYKNLVEWEIWSSKLLSNYKKFFDSYIEKKAKIKDKYICLYPWDRSRSLMDDDWTDVLKHILSKYNYKILLLWWEREKWFSKIIINNFKDKHWKDIINKICNTNLNEVLNILAHSMYNISCNGWIMRCWCILNENNLAIHIKSWDVYRPPEDWIHTINVTQKKCKLFCDWECRLKWTDKENICKEIDLQEIINWIDKIIKNL